MFLLGFAIAVFLLALPAWILLIASTRQTRKSIKLTEEALAGWREAIEITALYKKQLEELTKK